MRIVPASSEDAAPLAALFAAAFAHDPLMALFFGAHPLGRAVATERFFSLLLRARIALAQPALLARDDGHALLGGVMGYAPAYPDWPTELQREWDAFEASSPGLVARFEAYDALSQRVAPRAPHHYLGVIGVAPSVRGSGAGGALLDAFCAEAARDPASAGVYLETANPRNRAFYAHHGFTELGSGTLDGTDTALWCLFRPRDAR